MTAGAKLHELLHESARRLPRQAAFVTGDRTTSYAELDSLAGRFAASLWSRHVGRGDRLALLLDGRVDYLVACYGALKSGAAVVPLNPDTRPRILRHALSHCGARAVVTSGAELHHLAAALPDLPSVRLVVTVGPTKGELPSWVEQVPIEELLRGTQELHDAGAGGDDLASINYTSGTTGPPKGVMLAHRNLVANVHSIVEYLELTSSDTAAMVLPFFYVYGGSVLHTHIAVGGTIAAVGSMAFPAHVLEGIARHRATGLSGVPSTFARLVQLEDLSRYDLGSLRYVTQAGAPMTRALTDKLRAKLPDARIFVMYGQTEASARLAYLPPEDLDRKLGSAGKAIPGVELRIVDPEGKEVPRGTVGEIAAKGDNVMLGYLGDPEATARALRPEGLRTGDLATMDEEGFVYIAGRASEMIKSGGHRIGPQEIEEVIAALPGVEECAVVGVPDELLGESIAAFVVPSCGSTVDPRQVQRACHRELPRYKTPAHVHMVTSLPRSANGKLKRCALRERTAVGAPAA